MPKQPCELVRVPVAFNVNNPQEKPLLDHVLSQYNRSRYFKRLVERDLASEMFVSGAQHTIMQISEQTEDEFADQLF